MPTLNWIGKDAVIRHHKEVPFRLLEPVPELSTGDKSGNLLVQGDNLDALKALLPKCAGQVKLIYIDPPYNTGNEGWSYNDNVNSPQIRKWLGQVVGKEELDRHDRWLCMMYPRLVLLKQFLSENGIIAISIDDNELSNMLALLDEIFTSRNRIAIAPVLAEPSGGKGKGALRKGHEYLIIYSNGDQNSLSLETKKVSGVVFTDNYGEYIKGRELNKWGVGSLRTDTPTMWFPLKAPDGSDVFPIRNDGKEGRWRWGKKNKNISSLLADPSFAHWEMRKYDPGIVVNGMTERWVPYEKIRVKEKQFGWNTWLDKIGFNSSGTQDLKNIFGEKPFDTPKPISLVQWIINLLSDKNCIILDSFAGSGTTAHAVLKQNAEDGGNRRFILVEMDRDIAENVAAERIKRVSQGYENAKGQHVDGLGGDFQYCRLSGEPLFTASGQIRKDVTFSQLASFVWFLETKTGFSGNADSPLLGVHEGRAIYLLYNGILGDTVKDGGNVLTPDILAKLPEHDGPKTIYASSAWGDDWLEKEDITFKQTPYKLKTP